MSIFSDFDILAFNLRQDPPWRPNGPSERVLKPTMPSPTFDSEHISPKQPFSKVIISDPGKHLKFRIFLKIGIHGQSHQTMAMTMTMAMTISRRAQNILQSPSRHDYLRQKPWSPPPPPAGTPLCTLPQLSHLRFSRAARWPIFPGTSGTPSLLG